MVDPDNRRPVDYQVRASALNELRHKLTNVGGREAVMSGLFESWQDARIKLAVNTLLLDLRRMQEDCSPPGAKADQALGYLRSGGGERRRFCRPLSGLARCRPRLVRHPMASIPEGRWTDWLTGRSFKSGSFAMADLFATLPAVVLRPV